MYYYRHDLALIHDRGHGQHADRCAPGIVELLSPVRGGLVLELGCGSGALTRHLLAAGFQVIATDASPDMLALARASNLFSAGVDMHGVHDWNTELPTFSPNYDPRERVDVARLAFESSPMASVATWRSPVLLIHGDDDRNVPFAQTEKLVEALRRQKVDFEELIFPDEIHDFLLRRDWVRAYAASAEFLGRKLGAAASPQR